MCGSGINKGIIFVEKHKKGEEVSPFFVGLYIDFREWDRI